MQQPKPRPARRYWESLSDDQLVDVQLDIDNPELLEGLVAEIPPGDEETYVEFKYDLTGSGREEFKCVHGHHRHLKGFVMRKGDARFMVGWICGQTIYGEAFDEYATDFNSAVNRQVSLRRRREIWQQIGPFMAWLEQVSKTGVFKLYSSVRRQFQMRMPWIWQNLCRAEFAGMTFNRTKVPQTLFDERVDPEKEFAKIVAEVSALAATLIAQNEIKSKTVDSVRRLLRLLIGRVETVLEQLKEVEDFFQPAVLSAVCELANDYDNPKKRRYVSSVGAITCKREKEKFVVQMPTNYRLPNRGGLDALKASIEIL